MENQAVKMSEELQIEEPQMKESQSTQPQKEPSQNENNPKREAAEKYGAKVRWNKNKMRSFKVLTKRPAVSQKTEQPSKLT